MARIAFLTLVSVILQMNLLYALPMFYRLVKESKQPDLPA